MLFIMHFNIYTPYLEIGPDESYKNVSIYGDVFILSL